MFKHQYLHFFLSMIMSHFQNHLKLWVAAARYYITSFCNLIKSQLTKIVQKLFQFMKQEGQNYQISQKIMLTLLPFYCDA